MNAITDTTSSLQEAIRATSMIVTVSMSAWSPIRVDRALASDVSTAHDAAERAFSVRKNLFAGADSSFKDIVAIQASFRRFVYEQTLPFGPGGTTNDRGPRLLANAKFFDFTARMVEARTAMNKALALAKTHYLTNLDVARRNLGSAFKSDDYPDPASLDRLFAIDADFMPVPDGRQFKGLPDDTLTLLHQFTERQLKAKADNAARELSGRIVTYLARLRDRITALDATESDPNADRKATIRASLFDDATALVKTIKSYDFITDERLDAVLPLLAEVGATDRTALEDPSTRKDLIRRAADAFDCFN